MNALSAAEFREIEIKRAIELKFNDTYPGRHEYYKSVLPAYTELDYMDFAERYGDYICTFEKEADAQRKYPVPTAETEKPGGGE